MRANLLVGVAVAALCAGAAEAGPLPGPFHDEVEEAQERRGYSLQLWLPKYLADHGNVTAEHMLGDMYAFGKGVPESYVEAAYWYGKAARAEMLRPNIVLG
jgi:TPR repeat protein